MSFSDYLEDNLLDHTFRNTAFTSPAAVYMALFTVAPTDAGGGTEVTGGSYARAAITFGAAADGAIANSAACTMPTATAGWGTVSHFAIFDAAAGGNMLAWGPVGTAKPVVTDDTPEFAIGDIVVTLD